MKRRTLFVLTLLLPFFCSGCSITSNKTSSRQVSDHDYMAKINYAAKANGTTVIWINPPKKEHKLID